MINLKFGFNFQFIRDKSKDAIYQKKVKKAKVKSAKKP